MLKFEGTLFRFPLRSIAQAEESPILAGTPCIPLCEIDKQFTGAFFQQAKESLVFIRNINRLEFWSSAFAKDSRFTLQWTVHSEIESPWSEEISEENTPLE